jgi:hypothetical protein
VHRDHVLTVDPHDDPNVIRTPWHAVFEYHAVAELERHPLSLGRSDSSVANRHDSASSTTSTATTARAKQLGQPISQIVPSRTSTGNVFSARAPVVALTAPASGLNAPWGPRSILPVATS